MSVNNKILAVIVLYKETLLCSQAYESLLKRISVDLFVFDNSPEPQHTPFEFDSRVIYIHDKTNPGLSKAYNQAAAYAAKNGKEWLLLLDQDTIFPENAFEQYLDAMKKYPNINLFVPILQQKDGSHFSPTSFKKKGRKCCLKNGINSLKDYTPVNSGMLINVVAFHQAGGYNEKVRLDFADHQFTERLQKVSEKFVVIALNCIQPFSNNETDCNKLLSRFLLFCESAANCDKANLYDQLYYLYIVFKHTIALTIRTKSLQFCKAFISIYLSRSLKNISKRKNI